MPPESTLSGHRFLPMLNKQCRPCAETYSQFHSNYSQLDVLLSPLPTEGLSRYLVSLQNLRVGYLNHESIFAWMEEGI